MFEVWLQMSDTNIDTEHPSDLPALVSGWAGESGSMKKFVSEIVTSWCDLDLTFDLAVVTLSLKILSGLYLGNRKL